MRNLVERDMAERRRLYMESRIKSAIDHAINSILQEERVDTELLSNLDRAFLLRTAQDAAQSVAVQVEHISKNLRLGNR